MGAIKSYFDLRSKSNVIRPLGQKSFVIPQYVAMVVGIIAQPFIDGYKEHNTWPDTTALLGRVIFGLVVGFAIFPGVYRRAWDNNSPLFVQLCSIFSAGLGWQTLISAGSHLATGGH